MKPTLIYVYNADSGFFNLLSDTAHKFFSPDTYDCQLCAITHSMTGMHDDWKKFVGNLPLPSQFYHRDEFVREFQLSGEDFPAVYLNKPGMLRILVSAKEINACQNIEDLKMLISRRLQSRVTKTSSDTGN